MTSTSGEIASALSTVVASFIGGSFILAAALIAWRSVQMQIGAQARAEGRKQEANSLTFRTAVTAELLAFSASIIEATSVWNLRAHQDSAAIPSVWPTLMRPRVYEALLPQIGLLDGWVAAAVISFYGQVLDLNELSAEAMRERPTSAENNSTIAKRFQTMAKYLADSLDGLNSDRQFPMTRADVHMLREPNGTMIGYSPRPKSLQEVLYTLAGDSLHYVRRRHDQA